MISIIIPIYNAENELARMLDSIRNQTIKDYEVIMIDDGSADNSAKVCNTVTEVDKRFRYYYQDNKGVSVARNNGLAKAKGEYVAFVDADDEIDANYLEALLDACQCSDIAVCDTVVEQNGKEIRRFTSKMHGVSSGKAVNLLLERRIINSGPGAKMFKREVIGEIRFPDVKIYEDIMFNLLVFSNATDINIISHTQYHYIENLNGAMNGMKKAPSKDIIVATDWMMRFIKEREEIIEEESVYITVSHLFQYVLAMVNKECSWDASFLKEAKKIYKKYVKEILKCDAIPQKEKIVFTGFIFGWIYTNKKWNYIGDKG